MITVLAMGQSNAAGWGAGGGWSFPGSVTVWNCAANTDTGFVGNAYVAPVYGAAPFTPGHNNMMINACRYLAAELDQDVRLILVAMGNQPIEVWSAVSGTMYARMKAVLAAAGVTLVDAFLWHQGESNVLTYATYEAAWNTLVGKLTADGIIDTNTPIVLGDLTSTTNSPNMNAVLRLIADNSDRIGLADIACLPTNDFTVDIVHFNGSALVRAGLEYARELMKLPGALNFTPAETDFPYVTAAGASGYTATSGQNCIAPVKAENGKKSLISGGAFVADRLGVWEFSLSAISYAGSLNIVLLDAAGAALQYVVGTTFSTAPHLDGSTVLALGKGDKVHLGVMQNSAPVSNVPVVMSALINRMTVKYLGRD